MVRSETEMGIYSLLFTIVRRILNKANVIEALNGTGVSFPSGKLVLHVCVYKTLYVILLKL